MDVFDLHKSPTGIESLDSVIGGGLPSGSLVLLLGDAGAGNIEFAYTSAVMLSRLTEDKTEDMQEKGLKIPEKVCYVSFIKSREDILGEIARIFSSSDVEALLNNLNFKDLSSSYHKFSITPPSWIASEGESPLKAIKARDNGLLESLIGFLNENAKGNLVILDSVTNLVRASYGSSVDWNDLISFLEGLQRVSKKWDGIIYAILGTNILDVNKEAEIADCADGVMVFDWMQKGEFSRQQVMYVKKFRGLLPQLNKDNISKFETSITVPNGFEMKTVRIIRGHNR
ncbi:MAG: RAD55 family ATPase [Halobacteriota archaeon]|nr:RAD55 family ATPase [Halobacteriota archaeon]